MIDGRAPHFAFRHADGTTYGDAPSPAAVEATGDAFSALCNLGLGDGDARRALAVARTHVGAGAGVPDLVRAALRAHRERRSAILPPSIATLREQSPVYGRRAVTARRSDLARSPRRASLESSVCEEEHPVRVAGSPGRGCKYLDAVTRAPGPCHRGARAVDVTTWTLSMELPVWSVNEGPGHTDRFPSAVERLPGAVE